MVTEDNTKAIKILSVIKPILESIVKISGKSISWGESGIPTLEEVESLLSKTVETPNEQIKQYYSFLSNLRNQTSDQVKWGKGNIPELEYMDSTLAGLYSYVSEYVYRFH